MLLRRLFPKTVFFFVVTSGNRQKPQKHCVFSAFSFFQRRPSGSVGSPRSPHRALHLCSPKAIESVIGLAKEVQWLGRQRCQSSRGQIVPGARKWAYVCMVPTTTCSPIGRATFRPLSFPPPFPFWFQGTRGPRRWPCQDDIHVPSVVEDGHAS